MRFKNTANPSGRRCGPERGEECFERLVLWRVARAQLGQTLLVVTRVFVNQEEESYWVTQLAQTALVALEEFRALPE